MEITGRLTATILLVVPLICSQIWCLNDGKFPPPPPLPPPVTGGYYPGSYPNSGGKSWKGQNIFSEGPNYYPGKSWDAGPISSGISSGGWGSGTIVPIMIPIGGSFGGNYNKPSGGLLSGLKGKIKGKFSGLKGWLGGGVPSGGFDGSAGFGGFSDFGGKFSKFNKFKKYPSGGGSYPNYPISGGGYPISGGGGYPISGGGYPIGGISSSNACYDSSQCGLRSCCIPTVYGTRCQFMSPETINMCLDPRPQPPPPAIFPPVSPSVIFPPTISTGGKSWRPPTGINPPVFPPSIPNGNCRPGFCPRYPPVGPSGPYCQEDNDCPFPRKCCLVVGTKTGYDTKRTCVLPGYDR